MENKQSYNNTIFEYINNRVYISTLKTNQPKRILEKGLYKFVQTSYEWYLEYINDKFVFTHKIYNIDNFNDIILKSYNYRKEPTGILFNGIPGTGKTVQAKLLANKSNLPIIYTNIINDNFANCIQKLNSPCCILIDEFEKQVGRTETIMLDILDGLLKNDIPHLFVFTSNNLNINDRFICRPSRIRYIKTFDNITETLFFDIIKNTLNDKSKINEIINYIKTIKPLTIDIVKSVVDEFNATGQYNNLNVIN